MSLLLLLVNSSCKKLLEVDPPINQIVGKKIYDNPANAAAVLTGLYHDFSAGGFAAGSRSLSVYNAFLADELIDLTGKSVFYTNALNAEKDYYWTELYQYIFRCNSAIEGVNSSDALSAGIKKQLTGEAVFARALAYFYLVNLFGDVPLLTSTDYTINSVAPRLAKDRVYAQIVADLQEAQEKLSEQYLNASLSVVTAERVRPVKAAATALLARVYLYTEQWGKAEEEASKVIGNTEQFALLPLNEVFLMNSKEAIWQLQPVTPGMNTQDGNFFIPFASDYNTNTYLSNFLLNAFEAGDQRKVNWVKAHGLGTPPFYYPYKYKIRNDTDGMLEYLMVLRLGEQYLIRAEARAQQDKLTGAQGAIADLDAVRLRAGLTGTTAATKSSLLEAIAKERQVELFTEWGHRWFDLKRTGKIDEVMSVVTPAKGGEWNSNKQLYPIPSAELSKNPSLAGHQNAGY